MKILVMDNTPDGLSEEELKKKAYLMAQRLKSSGIYDVEVIYARLEKHGFSELLAMDAAKSVMKEQRRQDERVKEEYREFKFSTAWICVGAGVVFAIISAILFPDRIIVPIGLIVSGIVTAIIFRKK